MAFNVTVDRPEEVASLTPSQVRKGLDERQDLLHRVFEEAGPELDAKRVTVIEVPDGNALATAIKSMNEQMGWFTDRVKDLDAIDSAKAATARARAWAEAHPGSSPDLWTPSDGDEGKGTPAPQLSIGQAFIASGAYKAALAKQKQMFDVKEANGIAILEAKSEFERKTVFSTSAGWAPESLRTGRVVLDAQREIEVTDAIPSIPTTQAAIVYMEETTFTNNAAERSEAAAYAESALALTEQSVTVRSIGTSLPVTDEQLEDEQGVAAYLDQRLSFMVRQRLDGQILNGSGVSPNLIGTYNVSGLQTQAKGADSVPDAVYKAMVAVRVTGRAMTNVVFAHPNDWQGVRLLTTADGVYIWGSPSEAGPSRIWGVPVIETTAATENSMIVGDYARHSSLYVRRGLDLQTGYVNDDFLDGRVTVRAGLRVAMVHYRPEAFCEVTGV